MSTRRRMDGASRQSKLTAAQWNAHETVRRPRAVWRQKLLAAQTFADVDEAGPCPECGRVRGASGCCATCAGMFPETTEST